MNLKGNEIKVCLGTGCYTKGATQVVAEFERLLGIKLGETSEGGISLGLIRCVGRCAQAPVAVINEQVYSELTQEKIGEIVAMLHQ